ncbi:MAG: FAD-binding oxidoreductase [Candidatus Dormiibacterota bacterium]
MTVSTAQELRLFGELVGSAHVRAGGTDDAVGGVVPNLVVTPGDEGEVASVLSAVTACGLTVVARGGGTKINWGSPPERCDVVLSTTRIEGIVDHEPADLVCVVRAGSTLSVVQEQLAAAPGFQQRLMLDPPHGAAATIGGVVATAASGPLRTRFGTPRDLVIGASFVLSDGTRGRSGGKVVKNVAGFDVAKLLVGSLGSLAVITEVAFRLHPVPAASRTVLFESRSASDLCEFAMRVGRLQVTPSVVDLHWPRGVVVARFDSSERGASVQAERVVKECGGHILAAGEEAALTAALRDEPWTGSGAVGAIAVLPSLVSQFLSSMSATCDAIALRPLLGTGEVRFPTEATEMVRAALRTTGGRLMLRRGDAPRAAEPDDAVALDLMRSVKLQLDPARTLSPGRQVGGI